MRLRDEVLPRGVLDGFLGFGFLNTVTFFTALDTGSIVVLRGPMRVSHLLIFAATGRLCGRSFWSVERVVGDSDRSGSTAVLLDDRLCCPAISHVDICGGVYCQRPQCWASPRSA